MPLAEVQGVLKPFLISGMEALVLVFALLDPW